MRARATICQVNIKQVMTGFTTRATGDKVTSAVFWQGALGVVPMQNLEGPV